IQWRTDVRSRGSLRAAKRAIKQDIGAVVRRFCRCTRRSTRRGLRHWRVNFRYREKAGSAKLRRRFLAIGLKRRVRWLVPQQERGDYQTTPPVVMSPNVSSGSLQLLPSLLSVRQSGSKCPRILAASGAPIRASPHRVRFETPKGPEMVDSLEPDRVPTIR